MIDIDKWLKDYRQAIINSFGNRVLFIGLQGSYGRKEATNQSDIDVVLILDKVDMDDLILYRETVDKLTHREILCGFVSGKDEIALWSRSDLFQFYFDTIPIMGTLNDIISPVNEADAKQAVLIGACNLYHACSHNFLHAKDVNSLQQLYKSAFFIMQAKYYCKTGVYVNSKSNMSKLICVEDKIILDVILNTSIININDFKKYSEILFIWAKNLILNSKNI